MTVPYPPPAETGAVGTTITCPCGVATTVRADGVYRVLPWPRWHVDLATSTISVVEAMRYICDNCYDALPDGDPDPEDGEDP